MIGLGFFSKIREDRNKEVEEEEEVEELDINLNIGTSGAKSASRDLSKKYDYEKIRAEVDMSTVKKMIRIIDKVETKTQYFTNLEDEGVPLITLVALGVTTEEAINSYRTMRARGLDTYKADLTRTQRVDDEYENEVNSLAKEYPSLKLTDGGEMDEPMSPEELYKLEVKNRIELEDKLREYENKIRRLEETPESDPTYEERVQSDILDIEDMFEDDLEETIDSEEELSDEEYKGWSSEFESLKDVLLKDKEQEEQEDKITEAEVIESESSVEDGKYQAVKSVHKLEELKRKDKEIFVLSEPFEVEEDLEGYKVIFIEEPNDLVLFTASKDNLLVITRAIPLQLVEMFIEWVGTVASKGVKIRAVTLKGMEIEHAFIEGVIELTQESLDNYYEQNKISKYIGTGVDTFFDIGESIDEVIGEEELVDEDEDDEDSIMLF